MTTILAGCVTPALPQPELPISEAVGATVLTALPPTPTPLPTVEPAEQVLASGLRWRECRVSSLDWRQAEACLGYTHGDLKESDGAGVRLENGEWRLRVDGVAKDVAYSTLYETRTVEWLGLLSASLYRDGRRVHTFIDRASGFSPHLSLRLVGDQVAWAFSGERVHTVAYGGRDLRVQYDLDAVYAPYELDGKLIVIGKRDGLAYVLYDDERIGPSFENIITAYCCEAGLYAPFAGEGWYGFWGERDGGQWVVEIAPVSQAAP
jgi:hypothetical protein